MKIDRFTDSRRFPFLRVVAKDPRSAHHDPQDPCQRVDGASGTGLDEPQALTS